MMNVSIIGGGVAGTSTALKLAEWVDPKNIILVEKKPHFKKACSGILTYAKDNLIKIPDDVIVSKITKFKIISPSNKILEVNFKRPDVVCEREKLNEHLTNKCSEKGIIVLQPATLQEVRASSILVNNQEIPTTHLVGADGFQSTVAKLTGLNTNKKYFVGAKAIIKKEHDDAIEVYPNYGCFAWAVPHGDGFMEVGTMSYPEQGAVFDKFMKRFDGCKIMDKSGALIPVHNPFVKTYKKHGNIKVYLAGDAAGMVKATTGGSIIQSFIASQCLADSIVFNKNYSWRKKLGLDLALHLITRKFLDRLNEQDWDDLVTFLNNANSKKILETESRDNLKYLLPKLVLKNPRVLKYLFRGVVGSSHTHRIF
ncbi:NAD(P)/FAD-dependent oxidoreductase [Candidatus Woesearchaeota archaeon]|nr:NAD(P)/FAD-dependent oxidoreductase [Candidatus Woesearchaeota archaeon]